jgi:hypothetical protein
MMVKTTLNPTMKTQTTLTPKKKKTMRSWMKLKRKK